MTRDVILTLSLLLVAGLFARLLATLLRVPEIVFLLGLGALLGPSALDVIDVPLDSLPAQLVFTLGVSTILFYGGLNLSLEILRKVWLSLGLLAVVGVIVTAVITGAAAALVFGLPFEQGLLIGAVLSPTDPAILIPLFIGSRLRPKVAQTVVAESAFNDPTGAVLALAVAGALVSGRELADRAGRGLRRPARAEHRGRRARRHRALGGDLEPPHGDLARVVGDRGAGRRRHVLRLARLRRRQRLPGRLPGRADRRQHEAARALDARRAQPRPPDHDAQPRRHRDDLRLRAGRARTCPSTTLGEEILPALAVVAVLLLVARPITVAICCLPDRRSRWSRAELAFVCWTRETGVVPAALVGVLAALAVPNGDLLASVVALAILVTLAVQAVPAPWLARRLGLLEVE